MALVHVLIGFMTAAAVAALVWALAAAPAETSRQRLRKAVAAAAAAARAAVPQDGVVPALKHDWRRVDTAPTITELLERMGLYDRLQVFLLRAGLLLRPSEFTVIVLFSGALAFGVMLVISRNLTLAILAGLGGLLAPWAYASSRAERRRRRLTAQLPNALDIIAASLRAGYALPRALQTVASQSQPPLREEFSRLVYEIRLGVPIQQALNALSLRTGSYDFELMVIAMQIQLAIGGNLAEVLQRIADLIRERMRLEGEIQALTAEGRMSVSILIALPFVIGFVINAMSPGYLSPLLTTPFGRMMLVAAAGLMFIGSAWLKRMIAMEL